MRFRLYEEKALEDPVVQDAIDNLPDKEESMLERTLSQVDLETAVDDPSDITHELDRCLNTALRAWRYGRNTAGAAANILLVGRAGTGKSSIVRAWADKRHINLVQKNASSFDKADMGGGVAAMVDDAGKRLNKMTRLSNAEFDSLQKPGSVLFLDELNRADPEVMGSLLTLILDHKVPDTESDSGMKDLPGFLFTIAAINPYDPKDKFNSAYGGTNQMDMAMLNRFQRFEVEPDVDQFKNYQLNRLQKDVDFDEQQLAKDDNAANREALLGSQGRLALANAILSDTRFAFDDADVEKRAAKEQSPVCSPRSFEAAIDACDGTKDDLLRRWPSICGYYTHQTIKSILNNYVDVKDKANSALGRKRGTRRTASGKKAQGNFKDTAWDKVSNALGEL